MHEYQDDRDRRLRKQDRLHPGSIALADNLFHRASQLQPRVPTLAAQHPLFCYTRYRHASICSDRAGPRLLPLFLQCHLQQFGYHRCSAASPKGRRNLHNLARAAGSQRGRSGSRHLQRRLSPVLLVSTPMEDGSQPHRYPSTEYPLPVEVESLSFGPEGQSLSLVTLEPTWFRQLRQPVTD